MVFYGDDQNKSLSEGIVAQFKTSILYPEITVFPDGARRVRIDEASIVEKDVVFLKTASVTPNIDAFTMETAFLIDAFKRSGAKSVTAIIPYVPYSRSDHVFRDGESVPLEVVIGMFESAGLSKIVFVDPHTIKMEEMFNIDVVDVSALPAFAEKINDIGFDMENAVIVSPDMGGQRRMQQVSEMLGGLSCTSIDKERDYETGEISSSGVHGGIKETCFIIDDIISSGKTMVQAIDTLKKMGAKNIYVFASHPILSENASELLEKSYAKKIFVTDGIPVPQEKMFPKLEILSLAPVLSQALLSQ